MKNDEQAKQGEQGAGVGGVETGATTARNREARGNGGGFYGRAMDRLRAKERDPNRTMYAHGRDPGMNPAMAAAAGANPAAVAHGTSAHDDGDRDDGGQGVLGIRRDEDDAQGARERGVAGAGWATTDDRGGRGGRGAR